MAGGIAHDFNNLLTSIMGNTSLIDMVTKSEHETGDYCIQINKACKKAANLCEQMLAYSGQGRYTVKALSITEFLKDMRSGLRASMHAQLDGRGKIIISTDEVLPMIDADEGQFRQVVTNLVVNASESLEGREEGGVIHIKARSVELSREQLGQIYAADDSKEGHFISLEVMDNGEGMEKGTLERVFDPFFTTRFIGRGLGLPAVMGVMLGHKGALNIKSQFGKGTRVQLFFPCSDSQGDFSQQSTGGYSASIDMWSGMGIVLIVDDDQGLLTVASSMIERIGFSVLCAKSGMEAIKLYKENRDKIAVVLLDWNIPEMDGAEVARALHHLQPGLKILLSSGYSEEMVMQSFAPSDVAGFIHKPYSFKQLKHKLREVIVSDTLQL